ncbi:MAG: ABC transporter ATP-binding protein [Bacteroidia bacterium]|nr:ABC transporter ATP-binding protein [Bacteroidia bacterium]
MHAVIIDTLSKVYGKDKIVAVDRVSLEVKKGELFGLIGPDGAGKTSIFRILTTLLLPSSGSARVDGYDVVKDYKSIRSRVGYMPGRFSLYQDLSVEENLTFFANLFNTSLKENYKLIEAIYVQLEPFKNRKAGKLSGGMKQKLALCCALIHQPSVLFLDEPTTGVDAVSRKEFWDMLKRLKEEGITIMVSTPYMDEAKRCDRIALIQSGKLLSVDTPAQVTAAYSKKLFSAKADNMIRLLYALRASAHVSSCYAFGETHHFHFQEQGSSIDLLNELKQAGLEQIEIENITPGIEDCFIDLMLEKTK